MMVIILFILTNFFDFYTSQVFFLLIMVLGGGDVWWRGEYRKKVFESCGRGWEGLLYNLTLFSFQQVVRFVDGLFCYDDVGWLW